MTSQVGQRCHTLSVLGRKGGHRPRSMPTSAPVYCSSRTVLQSPTSPGPYCLLSPSSLTHDLSASSTSAPGANLSRAILSSFCFFLPPDISGYCLLLFQTPTSPGPYVLLSSASRPLVTAASFIN